ncbi:MAG: D-glycerate dehydrogenase [Bacteriovorax sp.]|nr:D-glycerate dehydrogenase [Bacteriovorax sp.]
MRKKVFITRSILPDGADLMRAEGLIVDISELDRPMTYEELKSKAHSYDALITMLTDQIDEAFLHDNSHLKVISNYAVGFNNIDVLKASALKIPIGNTPNVLTEATAEVALGLMIAASRNFLSAERSAENGLWKNWHPTEHIGFALSGKTLGIIGLGRIGQRLAGMCAHAFNMKIIYLANSEKENSLSATKVELSELLANSDFISLHVPLNNSTKKMIGKAEFKSMKKNAVLVNTSRGEIIDQAALINALKENLIFAAGLDVTDPEPLPKDNELFQLKNAIVLPHIGSATYEARRAMSVLAAKNIIAGLKGLPLEAWVNKKDLLP